MAPWTRLVRFVAVEDGQVHYGEPVDDALDVGLAVHEGKPVSVHEVVGSRLPFEGDVDAGRTLTVGKLLSPVPAVAGSIRCLGINFRKHVEEAGQKIPIEPVIFMKPHTALAGPGDVLVPRFVHDPEPFQGSKEQLDYETELAFVVSRDAKNIKPEDAHEYVLGALIPHLHWRQTQWNFAKSFDGFCPIGPMLVSPSVLTNPNGINFTGSLNGELRQQDTTADWIFDVTTVLSFISQGTTIPAGTVILMGTPSGIGWFRKPPALLHDGDVFSVWHDKIGTLVNKIVFELAQPMGFDHFELDAALNGRAQYSETGALGLSTAQTSFSPLSSLLAFVSQDTLNPVVNNDMLLNSWLTSDPAQWSAELPPLDPDHNGDDCPDGGNSFAGLLAAAAAVDNSKKNVDLEGSVLSPDDLARKLKLPRPAEPTADLIPSLKYLDATIRLYFQPTYSRARQPPFVTISIVSIGCLYMGAPADEQRGEWIFDRLNRVILETQDTWMADPKLQRAALQAAVLGQCFAMLSSKRTATADSYHGAICAIARDLRLRSKDDDEKDLASDVLSALTDAQLKVRWEQWALDEMMRRAVSMLDYHAAHLTSMKPDLPFQLLPRRPVISGDALFEAEDHFAWRRLIITHLEPSPFHQPSLFRATCEIGYAFVRLMMDRLLATPWTNESRSTTVAPFYAHHVKLLDAELQSAAVWSAQQCTNAFILFHYACFASLIRLDQLELAISGLSRDSGESWARATLHSRSGRLALLHCAAILQLANQLQEIVFIVPTAILHAALALIVLAKLRQSNFGSVFIVNPTLLAQWASLADRIELKSLEFDGISEVQYDVDTPESFVLSGKGSLQVPGFADHVDQRMDLLRSSCIKLLRRTSPWDSGLAIVEKLLATDL
ncbi:hypothetical protein OIV83_005623 [Microbotryomycetes sp. JL201]|nr:hypothetical protein OIV83_005623 [Microbotryomycetes sp. JL201]